MILLFWFICLLGTHLALATHPPVCLGPSPTSPSCEFQALIRDAHGFTLTLTKDKQGQLVGSDVPLNGTFPVPDGNHTLMYLWVDGDGHLRDRDDQWCWAVREFLAFFYKSLLPRLDMQMAPPRFRWGKKKDCG